MRPWWYEREPGAMGKIRQVRAIFNWLNEQRFVVCYLGVRLWHPAVLGRYAQSGGISQALQWVTREQKRPANRPGED